jgi:hypothetical protein
MKYIQEDTTKRHKGNTSCCLDDFVPHKDDNYQYGCEFEFYVDTKNKTFDVIIEQMSEEIYALTNADILVDTTALPKSKDKDRCMQLKPDISLEENGVEISTPISTKEGVMYYIKELCKLIDKYGYTNEETGFHIHISTVKKDGINFNFYKYMLLCDEAKLLSSWQPRVGYSQNVMNILTSHDKLETRKIKTKKGTVWNLEKIASNHIEVKSMGGEGYHKQVKRLTQEFLSYAEYFDETLQQDTSKHKKLFREHQEQVNRLRDDVKARFVSALSASGILPDKK